MKNSLFFMRRFARTGIRNFFYKRKRLGPYMPTLVMSGSTLAASLRGQAAEPDLRVCSAFFL